MMKRLHLGLLMASLGSIGNLAAQEAPADPAAAQPTTVESYEGFDLQTLFEKSGEFMEASNWEEALKPLTVIINDYGDDALETYGPMFGVMYYRIGFCHKNLKDFTLAIEAYEKCYNDFPNTEDTDPGQKNPVWELTRLEMGIVKQAQGNYAEAIKDYEAFANQPAAPGTYDPVAFRIQAAACYAKAGQPDRAKQLVEQLFSATGNNAPRADALLNALLTLTDDWAGAEDAGTAETEAISFMDLYAGKIAVRPYDMVRYQFNGRVLAIARKASDNGQQAFAIRLLTFYASASDILRDLQSRALTMGSRVPDALKTEIEKYQAMVTSPDSSDWLGQLVLAGAYERLGSAEAAFAIYQRCINDLKESPHRELMMFGAMRNAMALNQMDLAQRLGKVFRSDYPDSKYNAIVGTMMLESLFFSQQHQEALDLALDIRDTLKEDSEEHDLTTFVVGAALFNLGRVDEAQPELTQHIDKFPESRFTEYSRYFLASSYQKQKNWEKGGELLDAFIKEYPKSDYLGFAMLDRSMCYFQLGKYQECLDVLGDLQKTLPDFPDLDSAIALRGDAHLMLNNNEQAEAAYLKARELAMAAGARHHIVLGRVLVQLIRVSKSLKKSDQLIQFYDEYMKGHKGGFYDAQVIVSAMDDLKELDRGEEALDELAAVIIRLGSSDGEEGIEEAIGSYTENAIALLGPEALLEKLTNFVPEGTEVNTTLKAWLIMARIDLLQNDGYQDLFPRRDAQTTVAFQELQSFDKADLATYIVVQVGRNLANQGTTESDAAAIEWFDEALERGMTDYYPLALMGKARILATGGGPAAMSEAVDAFDRVIRELQDKPDYVEEAMVSKGRLYYDKEMWKEASDVFFEMQGNTAFTRFRPEVFFKLARSYEEMGKVDQALEVYTPFVAPPLENYVDYSAEARVRATELQIDKGNKDKAFKLIKDTVSRMYKLNKHPVAGPHVERAKELYRKLRDETGATPDPDEGIWGVR